MSKVSKYRAKTPNVNGHIDYTDDEHARWSQLYSTQIDEVYSYAADACIDGLEKLQLPSQRIPQCREVSSKLLDLTGWRVQPVPALINFDRFYTMLAERVFPAAAFVRGNDDFDYIEEPDIFHEIFGHTPLLTDPRFADFSHAIGLVGQQCGESMIHRRHETFVAGEVVGKRVVPALTDLNKGDTLFDEPARVQTTFTK